MKLIKTATVTCLLLILLAAPSLAGSGTAPSFLVYPGNVQSVDWNPAMQGINPYNSDFHLSLIEGNVWLNAWTAAQIIQNINTYWDEDTKNEMLNAIPSDALKVGASVHAGIYYGHDNWSISQKAKGHAWAGIDKKLFQALLEGMTLEDLEQFELKNNNAEALAVADTGFTMSFPMEDLAQELGWDDLHLGGGIHYLYGLAWGEGNVSANLEIDEDFNISGEAEGHAIFSATGFEGGGGHGLAGDLGFWGQISPELGVGVSLNNLGFIRWNGVQEIDLEAAIEANMDKILDEFLEGDGDLDDDWFDYTIPDFDELDFTPHDAVTRGTPFALQGGIHYQVTPRIHLTGAAGFNQDPTSHIFISAGSRFFFPPWMPVSFSIDYASHKGTPTIASALELHLGPWHTHLSISDIKLIGAHGKEASIGISTSIRF